KISKLTADLEAVSSFHGSGKERGQHSEPFLEAKRCRNRQTQRTHKVGAIFKGAVSPRFTTT
ncbi:hypothetical protein OS493_029869, partial [Desmophyllum pertusum]